MLRRNKLALYLHLVWRTWDRQPLITPAVERPLLREIEGEARHVGCVVQAVGCTGDHVHLVVSFPTTASVADLVKQVKGVSSRFANSALSLRDGFKWQYNYGAFTVGKAELPRVVDYVRRQKEHHDRGDLWPEWEESHEEVPAREPEAASRGGNPGGRDS